MTDRDSQPIAVLGHELERGAESWRARWSATLGDAYVTIWRRPGGLVHASAFAGRRELMHARFEPLEGESTEDAIRRVAGVVEVLLRDEVAPAEAAQ